jgi:hypothetical protein
MEKISANWLRVLDTTETPQVDQGIRHQFHPVVALLDVLKPEQQPLAFVLPRKGALDSQAERMEGGIEEPRAPALRALTVARILGDVGEQARIENALPVPCAITTAIEVEVSTSQVQPHLLGDLLQGFQALRQQDHIRFIDGRHGDGR